MSELSNAVTVLIARMESHPEDFTYGQRLGHMSNNLNALLGLEGMHIGRLIYLTEADRAALADAWRALNYTRFEKEIMEATFKSDAEFEEEKKKFAYPLGIQGMNAQAQIGAIQPGQIVQPYHNAMNAAQNSSGNAGLFGSAGSALQGLF